MMSNTTQLWANDRYVAPYDWLISKDIREYDISKANISILLDLNIISKKQYEYYKKLPKHKREVYIGLYLRDNPSASKSLSYGFKEARRIFMQSNQINDQDVLYIDKDSITVINKLIKYTKISDHVEFVNKVSYTSFYRLFGIDFLYYNNNIIEYYRLKYSNDEMMRMLHSNGILDMILSFAYTAQNDTNNLQQTISLVRNCYNMYISRRMDINFYREFNQASLFKLIDNGGVYTYYSNQLRDDCDRSMIDISYNASIIRQFFKYYVNSIIKGK